MMRPVLRPDHPVHALMERIEALLLEVGEDEQFWDENERHARMSARIDFNKKRNAKRKERA